MRAERKGGEVWVTLTGREARYLLNVAREAALGIELEHSRSAVEGYEELEPEAIQTGRFLLELARGLEAALEAEGGVQVREHR
jgi:hypothetical protein